MHTRTAQRVLFHIISHHTISYPRYAAPRRRETPLARREFSQARKKKTWWPRARRASVRNILIVPPRRRAVGRGSRRKIPHRVGPLPPQRAQKRPLFPGSTVPVPPPSPEKRSTSLFQKGARPSQSISYQVPSSPFRNGKHQISLPRAH